MISKFKSLKNNQGFMKYFKNTSWLLGEKVLRLLVALFVGIWVARYLGPKQFGLLNYAQSFVGLFMVIASMGLDSIVVKELVNDKSTINKTLGTAFILKLIGAIIVFLLIYISIHLTSNDSETNFLIYIIMLGTIGQAFNVIDLFFQSQVISKYAVYANLGSMLISSCAKIILILSEAPLIAFAIVSTIDVFVVAIGLLYFYSKQGFNIFSWQISLVQGKKLLSLSWPLILSGFVVSIYMKIDQVMIKEFLDNESVGYYAAAVKVSSIWLFLPMIIANSLFPAIINAKNISYALYYERLQKMYILIIWFAIVFAIFVSVFAKGIVYFLYGKAYMLSSNVLIIHVWSGIFIGLLAVSGKWYIIENLTKHIFMRNAIGLLINVGMNIILIPIYSIKGAAFATLVSYFFSGYLFDVFSKKTRESFITKTKAFNIMHLIKKGTT